MCGSWKRETEKRGIKLQELKMQDWKRRDRTAGLEIAFSDRAFLTVPRFPVSRFQSSTNI